MTQLSLSIEEAATITGIGKTKLYEVINSGALRARKLGKRTIILKTDIEEFLGNLESYSSTVGRAQ